MVAMSDKNPFTNPGRRKDGEMNQSNLIQRLEAPWFRTLPDGSRADNPFNFGGGLKNGGLSEDAMKLLRDIFSFDYMGAAEFEFGAVPEALQLIAQKSGKGELVAFSILPKDKDVGPIYAKRGENDKPPLAFDTIYVICGNGDEAEVERRIRLAAKGKEGYYRKPGDLSLKEPTRLASVLRGEEFAKTRGWLELDNGFFFFVDKDMYEKTAKLFGVTT
jgi:hypothetical protein